MEDKANQWTLDETDQRVNSGNHSIKNPRNRRNHKQHRRETLLVNRSAQSLASNAIIAAKKDTCQRTSHIQRRNEKRYVLSSRLLMKKKRTYSRVLSTSEGTCSAFRQFNCT